MKKILGKDHGVSVGTQPLSLIMEEKMTDKLVPTAVLTMEGELKRCLDDQDHDATLSSPEEEVLGGAFPCLIGHPESWSSAKVIYILVRAVCLRQPAPAVQTTVEHY